MAADLPIDHLNYSAEDLTRIAINAARRVVTQARSSRDMPGGPEQRIIETSPANVAHHAQQLIDDPRPLAEQRNTVSAVREAAAEGGIASARLDIRNPYHAVLNSPAFERNAISGNLTDIELNAVREITGRHQPGATRAISDALKTREQLAAVPAKKLDLPPAQVWDEPAPATPTPREVQAAQLAAHVDRQNGLLPTSGPQQIQPAQQQQFQAAPDNRFRQSPSAAFKAPEPVTTISAPAPSTTPLGKIDMHAGKSFGRAGLVMGVAETAVAFKEGNYKAAAQQGGLLAANVASQNSVLVEGATQAAAKLAPAAASGMLKSVPIAGQVIGAGFAAKDAYDSAMSGHTMRATISGVEGTLYSVAAGASMATLADCWNPTVVAPATVAVGASLAAGTITVGKVVYDNFEKVRDWYVGDKNSTSIAEAKAPTANGRYSALTPASELEIPDKSLSSVPIETAFVEGNRGGLKSSTTDILPAAPADVAAAPVVKPTTRLHTVPSKMMSYSV